MSVQELSYCLCLPCCCTVLLQHGADPNIRNTDGKSALDLAEPSAKAVLTGQCSASVSVCPQGCTHTSAYLCFLCVLPLCALHAAADGRSLFTSSCLFPPRQHIPTAAFASFVHNFQTNIHSPYFVSGCRQCHLFSPDTVRPSPFYVTPPVLARLVIQSSCTHIGHYITSSLFCSRPDLFVSVSAPFSSLFCFFLFLCLQFWPRQNSLISFSINKLSVLDSGFLAFIFPPCFPPFLPVVLTNRVTTKATTE